MNWKTLERIDIATLNNEMTLHHHAVQFIALAGKYLLPEKQDDSHTNMFWNRALNSYVGHELPQFRRVAIRLPDLSLCIFDDKDYIVQALEISGYTRMDLYEWLTKALEANRISTENLGLEMHYEIPDQPRYEHASFEKPHPEASEFIARMRTNAREILTKLVKSYPDASPVRIWPHHFDTGTFIPYYDGDKMVSGIGLGLAMTDEMVGEPYFYVNHWMDQPREKYPKLKVPGKGKWIINDWKGSVLPVSQLFSLHVEKQLEAVKTYFAESILETQKLIGI
ncbi:MAG TPA: hypothetical protein VJ939_03235 [Bacteroidales bacterium]|nr:hypothetical protein [Bacteroidales bacterium]